ncbi:type II toxin-antitoxin system VapC family toxin [Phormidesmis sp. 146-35]
MSFLCDTNIISELSRPQPNAGVTRWADAQADITISVVTLEEIIFGLTAKPNARIERWFEQFLKDFCNVLQITPEIARRAGELRGRLRLQGKPRSQADILIAATAEAHNLTLVTRNAKDFEDCGIALLNSFN